MLLKSTTLTFAISFSLGTEAVRSSPESAGTGAWVTGSCFLAIVPPVATTATVGRSAARDGAPQSDPAITRPRNVAWSRRGFIGVSSYLNFCGRERASQFVEARVLADLFVTS